MQAVPPGPVHGHRIRRTVTIATLLALVFTFSGCDLSVFGFGEAKSDEPRNLAVQVRSTSATLRWEAPRTDRAIEHYKVQIATSSKQWKVVARVPRTTRSHEITGLEPGTKYYFRVWVRFDHDYGKAAKVSATTPRTDTASRPSGPAVAPPVTAPPATAPPATAPPATAPPATAPPATDPPATDPPTSEPGDRCSPTAYPTDGCTGAPTTSGLQVHEGDLTVTRAGAVIDGYRVTGRLLVRASNVTIRNSVVYGGIDGWRAEGGTSFTVEDTTVGRAGVCVGRHGVGSENYTARRVRVLGFADGFWVSGSNVTIQGSYATMCRSGCWHSDGVQVLNAAGARNITIDRNVLDMRPVDDPCATTCPIFVPTDQNPGVRVTITNNVVAGGEDGICIYNRGSGSFPSVTGNLSVRGSHDRTPFAVYCGNIGVWSGNAEVDYDFATGRVIRTVRTMDLC